MPPTRSDSRRTQALLISTAERLFAEQGLDSVSLSEINREAGQRNKSALHYHFGSRDGLLKAILQRHREHLDDVRAKMLADHGGADSIDLHDAVSIMVRPLADKIDDRDSGAHYIRIMAQLSSTPQHPLNDWLFNDLPPSFAAIAPVLYSAVPRAPTPVRKRRAQLMNGIMFHSLMLESIAGAQLVAAPEEYAARREIFVNDLIDCICGLLTAPVSAHSTRRLGELAHFEIARPASDDAIPTFNDAATTA